MFGKKQLKTKFYLIYFSFDKNPDYDDYDYFKLVGMSSWYMFVLKPKSLSSGSLKTSWEAVKVKVRPAFSCSAGNSSVW